MKKALPLFIVMFALVFSACKKSENTNPQVYKVKYSIACSDCEVIYYKDTEENDTAEYHKNNSWTYTFNAKKGQTVLLFAYNTSDHPQGVTATIELNDSVLTTQTNYCAISGDAFVVDTIQ